MSRHASIPALLLGQSFHLNRLTDRELLSSYLTLGDEDSFAALVRRHVGRVVCACRQVLGRSGEIEDAVQATFLILVRRARGGMQWQADLGGWLFLVAHRVAVKLRRVTLRQRRAKGRVIPRQQVVGADFSLQEGQDLLHLALDRLPERYRRPLVLCYFDGLSRDEAARQLGWSRGAVKGRLERGRRLLRKRLERHGLSLSLGLTATLAADGATIPLGMTTRIVKASRCGPSGSVAALLQGGASHSVRLGLSKVLAVGALLLATLSAVIVQQTGTGQEVGVGRRGIDDSPKRVDLAKVDRTIIKQPKYESKEPRYCCLVFGPEAKHRVWLVHDGLKLYVDRNGNGDLTEPGECASATPGEFTDPKVNSFKFEDAGDIPEGTLLHKQLEVQIHKPDHLIQTSGRTIVGVRDYIAKNPDALAYRVGLNVELPELSKDKPYRITQRVWYRDAFGFLRFGNSPETAPVLHFRGPYQIMLEQPEKLLVDRDRDVMLVLGTPGVGPGTTVTSTYGHVPDGAFASVELTSSAKEPGGSPIKQHFELKERC